MESSSMNGEQQPDLRQAIEDGHYAKKQILCKDWLISWSHRSRFEIALRLAQPFRGKRILDHGCGDGTFLAMLMEGDSAPAEAVGTEIHQSLVDDCARRFGSKAGLSFVHASELDAPEHQNAYDALICMEVLEHVVGPEGELDRFSRLLKPGGVLIVSVPVETGLPLLLKQGVRRIAGWRGLGDYAALAPYKAGELARSVFAGSTQHIPRPIWGEDEGFPYHCHKGFNWMRVRDMIAARYRLEQIVASPVTWLPPWLGSQVWFVARNAAGTSPS